MNEIWFAGKHCDIFSRCDGNRETCPGAEHDSINITTGSAQFTDQSFLSVISYHNLTNKLYVRLTGFSASCGQLNFQWFLLSSSSACITASTVKGAFPNSNTRQTLTGTCTLNFVQCRVFPEPLGDFNFPRLCTN